MMDSAVFILFFNTLVFIFIFQVYYMSEIDVEIDFETEGCNLQLICYDDDILVANVLKTSSK